MTQLKRTYKVQTLASDLGITPSADPVADILEFCESRARKFLKDFASCSTPAQLLEIFAAKLSTRFEVINNDKDLRDVQRSYLKAGETAFATLDSDFSDDVFGITFRRRAMKAWEPAFVSVIDSRGEKVYRANYTKWHELGHLFVLTDQLRLSFTRTSCTQDLKDPEESLVDVIAGHFAFWPSLFNRHAKGTISFEAIERLRLEICPEASRTSTLLGLVKVWSSPCILIEARLGLKKDEEAAARQGHFGFRDRPKPVLRVTSVTLNPEAQEQGFRIHRQWRVPGRSVVSRLFESGGTAETVIEDLSWWETSTGARLPPRRVRVEARLNGEAVQALITPA